MAAPNPPFHLLPSHWLLADQVMLLEAGKPSSSRRPIADVVKQIWNTCFPVGFAPKTPSQNAIKQRYQTHFLGPVDTQGLGHESKVELADNMMDLVAMDALSRSPSELAETVKKEFFGNSTSELLTVEAIQTRYETVFLERASVAIRDHDSKLVEEAMSHLLQSSIVTSHARETETPTTMQSESSAGQVDMFQHNTMPQQDAIMTDASFGSPSMPPLQSSAPGSIGGHTEPLRRGHKRVRPNSTASSDNTPFYSPQPQVAKLQKQLRDSGYDSLTNSNDRKSLISHMNRLSIDIKPCPAAHTLSDFDNPCTVCSFPERQPKPRVYVAPEYTTSQLAEEPQRAEDIDADIMDNE